MEPSTTVPQNFTNTVDITPTPRILRILGDIPFEIWQCFAELVDNSIDAYKDSSDKGEEINEPRVDIYWSNESVPSLEREIFIVDNGPGMPLEVLQKAAKAGYTSNNPIDNLGLFGMGFNISTAKLGDETVILSATKDSSEWIGIRIDFDDLIKNQTFHAPIIREPKESPDEHGTKIIIKRLKDGVYQGLKSREKKIRDRLEIIYTPILEKREVVIYLQGRTLSPKPHCVWSESRFVMKKGTQIFAIQKINRDLGETYFDVERNRYLTDDEVTEIDINLSRGKDLPNNVIRRSRRLKGWIGIQRYSDPTDFGIDFIRNGRKILTSDKTLFSFENPDTGIQILEYPMELASTIGGRIVGELHVDYLVPTYQKNGFETSSIGWRLTVEAIRGAGPILPKQRTSLGYDGENDSPLGKLVNAYRRPDPGTKNLALPNAISKEFKKHYQSGSFEYQSDEKWYKAAQEADRERGEGSVTTPVNTGDTPSDNIDEYLPTPTEPTSAPTHTTNRPVVTQPAQPPTSQRDQLIQHAEKNELLSSRYAYGNTPGMEVTAWKVVGEQIKEKGVRVPCKVFLDGRDVDFFYDPTHHILSEYPITPSQLLLIGLSEKFATRDPGIAFLEAFWGLVDNHLSDERINSSALQEKAQAILTQMRENLPSLLGHRIHKAFEVIKEVPSDEEELMQRLLDEAPQLIDAYQELRDEAIQVLSFIPDSALIRLVESFPEEFLDKKFFDSPYSLISVGDENTKQRLKKFALGKILTYLKDLVVLMQGGKPDKHELIRYSNTLTILERRIVL